MISIHSPHTGRDVALRQTAPTGDISISSPHAGRDLVKHLVQVSVITISIPSPHTGRDRALSKYTWYFADFNPLSPYGERHGASPVAHGSC